jgi:outer membrane receptor protein involved in Fe transport
MSHAVTRRLATASVLATIVLSAPNAATAQDSSKVSRARADSTLRRTARLNQVTITSTPVERAEPLTVIHIDSLTLRLTPANSPWDLFRQAAGLEAHQQGQGPGFASDLSIRGFSSDHATDIATYIDGVPNNEPANGHAEGYNDLNLLFPQIITGLDIIKGPTSALYGNFSFGGTINVRTLSKFSGLEIGVGGGSFGNTQGYLITGFDHGATGGVFAVQGFHEDGWRSHSGNQFGHLHAAIVHDISAGTAIEASVDGYLTSYASAGFLDTTLYNAGQNNFVSNFADGGFKRHAQERVSLRTYLTENLEWRTTLYGQQGMWNFWLSSPPGLGGLTEGTGAETHEYDSRYGFGGTTALTFAREGLDFTVGVDARYTHAQYQNYAESSTDFRVDSVPLILASPTTQLSGGVYLQGGFDVTKYARINVGARYDQLSASVHQPRTDTSGALLTNQLYDSQHSKGLFTPKLGLVLRPFVDAGAPGLRLFANVSQGFRQTDGVVSDPTLPFIQVWDYEAGIKYDAPMWALDASFFRMDVSDEQTFDPALNTVVGGGQSRRNGLDLGAHWIPVMGVMLHADFTILDGFYTHFIDPNDGNDYSHTPIFNTSKYTGEARVDFELPGQIWVAQVGANFQGPYTPFEEPGILRPAYLLLNVAGGVKVFGNSEITLGVRNLLDTRYRELESGGQGTPGQGLTVYAGWRYRRP